MKYFFKKIEPKWQAKWEESKVFEAKDNSDKPKFYGLVEFPYPSGAGMHVGHIKAYSSLEVISRKRRMEGYNVLFPIGFDAFPKQRQFDPDTDLIPYTPPAYHLLGFDAALELPVKRGHQVRFMLSADNLLNREYKEYTNRSRYYAHDMGRDVRCGVNWIF